MRIDKTQILAKQFMFTVACVLQASSLLTAFLAEIARQDSWLVVLLGFIVCLPLIWIYRCLMVRFPDKNLIQILEEVYGRILGKIIGVSYLWFFVSLAALNVSDLSDFTKLTIMDETPAVVLMIMCILTAALALSYGVRLVALYSPMFSVISFIILAGSFLLLINQIHPEYLLPILDLPPSKYIQGTHIISTIPFGELVVMLMITPNIKLNSCKITKYLYGGFVMGGLNLLLVKIRDITVLGNTFHIFTLPSLVVLRLINLGEAFSRMEILFAVVLIMLLFFKVSFLYYVSVLAMAQLMQVRDYRRLILSMGALIVTYALTLYPNLLLHAASAREIQPMVWTVFEYLIPLLTLIIAKLRKLPQEAPGKEM